MALAVNINFENLYEIDTISPDLKESSFTSILVDGSNEQLKIEISNESHELLPDLYNLAFGPLDNRGNIDDRAELKHSDYSKVFSTILFSALTYLKVNNQHYIGVDGSDIRRAYLYYRFIQRNYDYLSEFFNVYGLKYYVRITRFGKQQYDNPFDFNDILASPHKIEKDQIGKIDVEHLFNYYVFNLKQ